MRWQTWHRASFVLKQGQLRRGVGLGIYGEGAKFEGTSPRQAGSLGQRRVFPEAPPWEEGLSQNQNFTMDLVHWAEGVGSWSGASRVWGVKEQ